MGCVVKKRDEKLEKLVQEIFGEGRSKYGTRPIKNRLLQYYGLILSRPKIGKVIKTLNLVVKRKKKFKNTTDSKYNLPIAPNLLKR